MARLAPDAALWGGLGDHIDLASLIFAKLPLDAFFRLRVVCKEWNRLASDRAFLLEHFSSPLQPPYFVVNTGSAARLLQRGDDDAGWTWTRLPRVKCDSSGVLVEDSAPLKRVFDLHARMVHALPVQPEMRDEQVVGIMTVDATAAAFRVVMGDLRMGTRIYDSQSGSWTRKASRLRRAKPVTIYPGRTVCAVWDEALYVMTPSSFSVHRFSVQDDKWSRMMLPVRGSDYGGWECCDFAAWQDRFYMLGLHCERHRKITVWELLKDHQPATSNDEGCWRVRDGMPDDLWLWVCMGKLDTLQGNLDIKSRFCGEHVLVFNSIVCLNLTIERAVLYNLDSRTWEKVDLPASVL